MTGIPPLLMIAEGRKPRLRKAPRVRPREHVLHVDTAGLLRRYIAPNWLWSHYPSGELRDLRTAAKLKAMGVQRGWPDLILLSPTGAMHCLELKRIGEDLSEDQEAFQLWAIRAGVPFAVARTMAEVQTIFEVWRCLEPGLYNIQVRRPKEVNHDNLMIDRSKRAQEIINLDNIQVDKVNLVDIIHEVPAEGGILYNVQDSKGGGS